MWLLTLNVEVNWEKVLHASSSCCCSSGLFAPYGVWHSTQPEKGKKKKPTHVGAEEKPRILSVLKFDSEVQDPGRQKANGGGGKADRQQTDWRTSVSANSPNDLQPPTEVSPFIVIERGACTMEPNLITLVREIRTAVLTAEWTWDIRFQSSSLWFFCAHRFKAHTGLVCVIYHLTSHFLRRGLYGLCGGAVVRDFTHQY